MCPVPSLSKVWWKSMLCILCFYFKNKIHKKNSKCLCEKNEEEEKKKKSPEIHQTLLKGGPGDLKTKNQGFGFIRLTVYCATDSVKWLNIGSHSTTSVIKPSL